jgi:hypothetical protein
LRGTGALCRIGGPAPAAAPAPRRSTALSSQRGAPLTINLKLSPGDSSDQTHSPGTGGGSSSTDPPEGTGNRRGDAPPVDSYTRGDQSIALSIASNPGLLNQARSELRDRNYASTSTRPREARLALWNKIMLEAGFQNPFELTPDYITTGAAVLRAAGFRSAMAYVDSSARVRKKGGDQISATGPHATGHAQSLRSRPRRPEACGSPPGGSHP